MKSKKNRLFVKQLVSYVIILLIPLIILNVFYFKNLMQTFRNGILNTVQLDTHHALRLLDKEFETLENTVDLFQMTSGFKSYLATNDFFTQYNGIAYGDIVEDILSLFSMNRFSSDFSIYFHEKDCVFSISGLHHIDSFIANKYRFQNITESEFQRFMLDITDTTIISQQPAIIHGEKGDFITFLFPVYANYVDLSATAIFSLEVAQIASLFSRVMEHPEAIIHIFDSKQTTLATINASEDSIAFLESGHWPHATVDEVIINSIPYFLISEISEESSLQCIALIPKRQQVFDEMLSISYDFGVFLIITLILSFIAIFFMMRVNYSPIKRLKEKAANLSRREGGPDELTAISETLDFLHDQNTNLEIRYNDNLMEIKNNHLRRLMHDGYESVQAFNIDSNELNLHFSHNTFLVTILLFHSKIKNMETLLTTITAHVSQYFECHYIASLETDRLIIINNMENASNILLQETYRSLLELIHKKYTLNITVGAGDFCTGTNMIAKSYIEAQGALDYRFVKGTGIIIMYSGIDVSQDLLASYPYSQFARLSNASASQNVEAIIRFINEIVDYIMDQKIPLFQARGICFDMVKLVSESIHIPQSQKKGVILNLNELSEVETAQEIVGIVKRFCEQLEKCPSESNQNDILLENINKYIEENCYNAGFSLQEVADCFSLLLPNLSTFYKAKTGKSPIDRVTDLRIDKAKDLLYTTSLPLKDIALRVGYNNVSSFIRRFKEHQGITPGSFRNDT